MKEDKNILVLIPMKSIGPFKLETSINAYSNYNLDMYESDDETGLSTFKYKEDLLIHTDSKIIVSLVCTAPCLLNDFILIGGNYPNFIKTFQPEGISQERIFIREDNAYQDVYDIDDLGLQLWCRNDIIVKVCCNLE